MDGWLIDLALTVPDAHVGHGAQTGDMSPLYWPPWPEVRDYHRRHRPELDYHLLDGVTTPIPRSTR